MRLVFSLLVAGLLAGCARDRPLRTIHAAESVPVPRYIELEREQSIATVHFPPGLYSLDSADHTGYYYRGPRRLRRNSAAGAVTEEGGLFLSGSNRRLRGYIVWAGGRTKLGNLSKAPHSFRD